MSKDKRKEKKYHPIQVNLTVKTIEIIDKAVEIGYGNSRGDFGRKAILSKLEELGLFNLEIEKLMDELRKHEI